MTRAEHLEWCKKRALKYVDIGEVGQAWISMVSDLNKHDETRNHVAIDLGTQLLFIGENLGPAKMRRFIQGFN